MRVNMYRHIKMHGVEVTVTNFTESGTDSYGDPTFTESSTTAQAIIDVDTSGERKFQTASGQDVLVPADIYIAVDDDVPIKDSDDGNYPTEITAGGKKYEVILNDSVNNSGVVHTVCRRI